MTHFIEILMVVVALLLVIPAIALLAQCIFGCPRAKAVGDRGKAASERPSVDVLIPAHNEETVIGATIRSILPQLNDGDRLLVVADNCDDSTASIARSMGADAIERTDETNRAKGFAIDAGLRHLELQSRDVVIMVDADCTVAAGAIERLSDTAVATGRPVQACYEMPNTQRSDAWSAVSEFAVMVKNQIRPLGLKRLGFGCVLTGSGMAFPSRVARIPNWANDNIVEDMKISYDLMVAGLAPVYCPTAVVTAGLPTTRESAMQQRRRWEHGHLQTLFAQVPRLLLRSILSMRPQLIVAAADLMIPPLSLFVQIWGLSFVTMLAIAWWLQASWVPVGIAFVAGVCLAVAILFAWISQGYKVLSLGRLCMVPVYIVSKIPLYVSAIFRRQKSWNRTAREGVEVETCT